MKTKRLILALTTWTVVIVMSLHSCQTDSGYDNVIQENNLTEADLFVASEAYKNLEKEIKKNAEQGVYNLTQYPQSRSISFGLNVGF